MTSTRTAGLLAGLQAYRCRPPWIPLRGKIMVGYGLHVGAQRGITLEEAAARPPELVG